MYWARRPRAAIAVRPQATLSQAVASNAPACAGFRHTECSGLTAESNPEMEGMSCLIPRRTWREGRQRHPSHFIMAHHLGTEGEPR